MKELSRQAVGCSFRSFIEIERMLPYWEGSSVRPTRKIFGQPPPAASPSSATSHAMFPPVTHGPDHRTKEATTTYQSLSPKPIPPALQPASTTNVARSFVNGRYTIYSGFLCCGSCSIPQETLHDASALNRSHQHRFGLLPLEFHGLGNNYTTSRSHIQIKVRAK